MKWIKRLWVKIIYEWLKLFYKETQFYYSNKIQDNHKDKKSVGAGKVLVFSNRKDKLEELQKVLDVSDSHLRNIKGYPAMEVIGSKIGLVKMHSKQNINLPINEIIRNLRKQKSDKL